MISNYTKAILCVAFFAIASQAAPNPDLKNPVVDLIKKFEEHIQNLVGECIKLYHNALNRLILVLDDVLYNILSAAESAIKPTIDQIIKINNDAIVNGIDITECAIDNVIAKIEGLPEVALREIQTCIGTLGETGHQTVAEGDKELKKIVEKVEDVADEAAKCGSIDPLCWIPLVPKITRGSIEIPVEVVNTTGVIMKSISDIKKSALECKTSTINTIVLETKSLLKNVTECVNRKSLD